MVKSSDDRTGERRAGGGGEGGSRLTKGRADREAKVPWADERSPVCEARWWLEEECRAATYCNRIRIVLVSLQYF